MLAGLVPAVTGCAKNELEELDNKEKKIISDYITSNNIPATAKQESGIYYIEKTAGTGISPVKNDYVIINYVGRYLEDGIIRETSYDSLKADWPLAARFTEFLYGPVTLQCGYSMPGINEALYLMKEGGKATVILPSDMANYDYKPLIYELQLLKVFSKPATFSDSLLHEYVNQNFGDTSQIADTTVWYKVTQNSSSESVFGSKDTIYFNFTGKVLDGYGNSIKDDRIFNSNVGKAVIKYFYGAGNITTPASLVNTKFPAGLKLAFDSAEFKNQTRVSVVMSYKMAFGDKGLIDTKDSYVKIPPYTNIVYDIQVVDIKQAP
jgi:hypothetical protein